MRRSVVWFGMIACMFVSAATLAQTGYRVAGTIKLGGEGFWDYLAFDSGNRRLYVSHGTHVVVVDPETQRVVGDIPDTQGVHGIAIADSLNKGFVSDGRTNDVTVFDLKSLQVLAKVPVTGTGPDCIIYEPKTQRVFTFNGRSEDSTVIDARTDKVVATIPLGGGPEFAVADGAGHVFDNIESTSEIVEIDAAQAAVTRRASVAPGEEPSGLAMDTKHGVLFAVCRNKMMVVLDAKTLKVLATPPIGQGPDAAGFDPGTGSAFSSNGRDGNLTVVKKVNGAWQAVETVPTERSARTMALDPRTHRVYLAAAQIQAPPAGSTERRFSVVPGSFHLVVVGR